jgi:hypothetical protein
MKNDLKMKGCGIEVKKLLREVSKRYAFVGRQVVTKSPNNFLL